jgi:oligopeptide transport system permease protein
MGKEQNRWDLLETDSGNREKITAGSRTFAQDVWMRFRREKSALIGLIIIVLLLLFAMVGPMLSPHDYYSQNLDYTNIPPFYRAWPAPDGGYYYLTGNLKVLRVAEDGTLGNPLPRIKDDCGQKADHL